MSEQHKHFLESQASNNPIEQFKRWFKDAKDQSPGDWLMAEAMSLSTANKKSGEVSSRMLLLKEVDAEGFVFYTNYESFKGQQIRENSNVAMLFYWPHLERQVRIEGELVKVSREESAQYFKTRPRGSQIGAWASKQSSVVNNRETLEQQFSDGEAMYKNKDVPLPDYWGGFRLLPVQIEFWQGRSNRLHDRLRYCLQNNASTKLADQQWKLERLSP